MRLVAGTCLVLSGTLCTVGSHSPDHPGADEASNFDFGSSPGSCLLQKAHTSVGLQTHTVESDSSRGFMQCQSLLPLLADRSDRDLNQFCTLILSKPACEKARVVLAHRPWSAEDVREACKHVIPGAVWHADARKEFLALIHRSGQQHDNKAEVRRSLDWGLKRKTTETYWRQKILGEEPGEIQQPPYMSRDPDENDNFEDYWKSNKET